MTHCDHVAGARPAYQPGDAVWVFVLGTWQPAVVIDTLEASGVLARYRRVDGTPAERAFGHSSVVGAGLLCPGPRRSAALGADDADGEPGPEVAEPGGEGSGSPVACRSAPATPGSAP